MLANFPSIKPTTVVHEVTTICSEAVFGMKISKQPIVVDPVEFPRLSLYRMHFLHMVGKTMEPVLHSLCLPEVVAQVGDGRALG